MAVLEAGAWIVDGFVRSAPLRSSDFPQAVELMQPIQRHDFSLRGGTPLLRAFRGLRPAPGRAADVIAPPYDVITSDEARDRSAGKPWSFLHISRAEIGRESCRERV